MSETPQGRTIIEDVREGDVFVVEGKRRENTALADPQVVDGEVHVPVRIDPPWRGRVYDVWFLPPDAKVEIVSWGSGR